MSDDPRPPANGSGAGPGARSGTGGRRPREGSLTAELGAELRAIRIDLTNTGATARATAGEVAELLPRLERIEDTLGHTTRAVRELLDTADDEDDQDAPVPTPAMGWTAMSEDDAAAAWRALAEFVGETLAVGYRLSRDQLPDCWPVHPRAVRELAWLRTLYLATTAQAARAPTAVAEWHTRWLPAAVANLREAIDRRECGPGIHCLTRREREMHHVRLEEGARHDKPAPTLAHDPRADRPRYDPQRFPDNTRSEAGLRDTTREHHPRPPTGEDSPRVLAPLEACEPRFWLDFYRDAVAEDLAHRRAATGGASASPGPAGPASGQS